MGRDERRNHNHQHLHIVGATGNPLPAPGTLAEAIATQALDRFGQPISVGDIVLFTPPVPQTFAVQAVAPVLDPRMPTGLLQVVLGASLPLLVPKVQPINSLIVVRKAAEVAKDLAAQQQQAQQQAQAQQDESPIAPPEPHETPDDPPDDPSVV
jgi:hypothetical protein